MVMSPRRPEPESPPDLLSAQEVARRLSIGVRTLYRLAEAGVVPRPIRFSRKLIRWRTADIERYLRELPPAEAGH
jgi:excisionase family DNA binding protein